MALLMLKQRSIDKGLILIADNYDQLKPYIDDSALTQTQRDRMFASWPGPVTWGYSCQINDTKVANWKIYFFSWRVTDHTVVKELCLAYGNL